jgi:hypothetical protein
MQIVLADIVQACGVKRRNRGDPRDFERAL